MISLLRLRNVLSVRCHIFILSNSNVCLVNRSAHQRKKKVCEKGKKNMHDSIWRFNTNYYANRNMCQVKYTQYACCSWSGVIIFAIKSKSNPQTYILQILHLHFICKHRFMRILTCQVVWERRIFFLSRAIYLFSVNDV